MPFAAAIPLIIGAIQAGTAAYKTIKDSKRPDLKVPSESSQSLSEARQIANTTQMPGAERLKRENRRRMTETVNAIAEKSNSPADLINVASAADEQRRLGDESVNAQTQQWISNNKVFYASALANMAAEKRRLQQLEDQRWMQEQAATANLWGGALQSLNAYAEREYTKQLWEKLGMGYNTANTFDPNLTNIESIPPPAPPPSIPDATPAPLTPAPDIVPPTNFG